jgi:alkylhydroperoxidase family enzyme
LKRYLELIDTLRARVLEGPGELDREIRLAAAERGDLPDKLAAYVARLHDEAYKIGDGDLAALIEAGYSEDQIFELTVSVALGAGLARLEAVKRAMEEAD